MFIPDQAKPIFSWWRELTGDALRVPSFMQQRQAVTIASSFTREEMELTVRYVKAQIAENEARGARGLNARSMTWQNFFGFEEACEKFQANFALAQQWAAKRQPKAAPAAIPAPETALYGAGAAAMAETLARLKGGKLCS